LREAPLWQRIFETVAGSPEPPKQVALDSTHVKAHQLCWRRKKGAPEQAIGVTKGGRSKLHALVDKLCRPWVIILTPGNVADCTVGPECHPGDGEAPNGQPRKPTCPLSWRRCRLEHERLRPEHVGRLQT